VASVARERDQQRDDDVQGDMDHFCAWGGEGVMTPAVTGDKTMVMQRVWYLVYVLVKPR
jgi:hypothetical protein